MNTDIRLHLLSVPFTITTDEYSHDAYCGKVKRFSPMMRSRGFEVYHYGIETSDSGASVDIDLMTKEEWTKLRIESFQFAEPGLSLEDATRKHYDPKQPIGILWNRQNPLIQEFNKRLKIKLKENYRRNQADIVCLPHGVTHDEVLQDMNYICVETGIGYTMKDTSKQTEFKIIESYSWMSSMLGDSKRQPSNYWYVIPNYFNSDEFKLTLNPSKQKQKIVFLGRITSSKGCNILVEIARRFPHVEFTICGSGDPKPYLVEKNITYREPIHGEERSNYLGDCAAVLCASKFLEPFCGVAVEAQLCGSPVISSDWGGAVETIEQFKTGVRCHTLADYCYGVQLALDGKFDRQYIRERAVKMFDMYNIAKKYEYVFKSVLDVFNGKNGWYSQNTNIIPVIEDKPESRRIYISIVYYGKFPNYFQLYLDSVKMNSDILTVILVTDIDTSNYNLPSNLYKVTLTKFDVQKRLSKFILDTYDKSINPYDLVKDNYKFVDFKIVYPIIFGDILKKLNVKESDYVGWGDIDLIYGKLSNFIKFEENYGILGGWNGHFTAIQNIESFKYNFKNIPNYFDLITDNSKTFITDEIAYRDPLRKYLSENNIKMFYTNAYFCDILPPCFYHMFRSNHKTRDKNFFDSVKPAVNIENVFIDKTKMIVSYDDNTSREALYCHMQKRKLDLSFTTYDSYYINETGFSVIPLNIWQTWETEDLPPKMKETVETLKKENPEFKYNFHDSKGRRNFIENNFPKEILEAYDALIPGAYKADLWRYCVLYIHGGIYLDIKFRFINDFRLISLVNKEIVITDGEIKRDTESYLSVCNGLLVSRKNNPLLLNAIIKIVYNITTKYMGNNPWEPTGPRLLGLCCKYPMGRADYYLSSEKSILDKSLRKVAIFYSEYSSEYDKVKKGYYVDQWNAGTIYNETTINLNKILEEKRWSNEFHKTLKSVLDLCEGNIIK